MIASQAEDPAADAAAVATAGDTVWRKLLYSRVLGLLASVIVGFLALGFSLMMIVAACFAVVGLAAELRELAVACLIPVIILAIASGWRDVRHLCALIQHRRAPKLPADWRTVAAGLDSRPAWRARALTAPLAALAGLRLVHLGVPVTAAVLVGVGAWLVPDVLRLLIAPALIRLHYLVRLLAPATSEPLDRREP